ncbi:MAG: hypothetical protein CMK09_16565 [Ponticaulis sp.]|nr:hypothetical protein [Ponticaulis sp.]
MTARYNDTYVPVMIEDCTLDTEFAKGQYEDLRRWSAEPAAYRPEKLIETLEEKLGRHATADRTTLKSLHEEWRKYGKQSLAKFSLSAIPDKREAEKQPPVDLEAAAKAASRMGEASDTAIVTGDAAAEFREIQHSLNPADYRLFLSHVPDGPIAFRAARQLKQLEEWDDLDQTNAEAIADFLSRHNGGKALFPRLQKHVRSTQKGIQGKSRKAGTGRSTPGGKRWGWLEAPAAIVLALVVAWFCVFGLPKILDTSTNKQPIQTGKSSSSAPPPLSDFTPEKQIAGVRLDKILSGHILWVSSVAFSPDGRTVLTGGGRTVRLWSVETGEPLHTLTDHESNVMSVAFSPDGRTVLTGSEDKTARLWSVETGKTLHTLTGLEDYVSSVAFSPDGRTMLTGSGDGTARLWSVETGETLQMLTGHLGPVWSVAFSPDGRTVLTGSDDGTARLWSVDTGETLHALTGRRGPVWSVAFSPDGRTVLTGSFDSAARLWSVETGETLHTLTSHEGRVSSVAFSPDGRTVLTGSDDKTARLWSVETGETLHTLRGHEAYVNSVAFSPDGRTVLTGSSDTTAWLWDVIYD